MKKVISKIGLLAVLTIIVGMFSGVTRVQAASTWSFATETGKKVEVNGVITLASNEFQDINLFKNGKEIKKSNLLYKVTWSSSDSNVVWVDAENGKLRADKFQRLTDDMSTAEITATIKNRVTGVVAKRSFMINVIKEKIQGYLDLTSTGWKSYNAGLNANMTGGTAGTLYPGAKLEILEECTNAKGTLVYRVYSDDLKKECYVTAKYVKIDSAIVPPQTTPAVTLVDNKIYGTLDLTSVGWSSYSVGVNANFTGGTLGKIYQGSPLEILDEVINSSGNKVYRVYSQELKTECYVSAKCVKIGEGSQAVIPARITEGLYIIHPKCAPNSALDVADWNAENGANLQLWETTKAENQVFSIKRENGYYMLQSEFSQKMVDVSGAVFESQNNVQLYEANGSDAQKWIITDAGNGYYMLIPYGNQNLALDVSGGGNTNGSNMWLYEINKSDAQLFKLERYYGSTEGLSRYECYSRNVSIVLEQIKNGTSEYINVGDKAYKNVWTWYYQKASSHDGAWCDVFAHYVLCLAGVDTLAYKGGVTYNVGDARDYYEGCEAYIYGNDVYDVVRTGDLILMRDYGHIGVVYVEGDKKYVIHGNYGANGDIKNARVCVHELTKSQDTGKYQLETDSKAVINGYVSMEAFLSNNTDIEVSRELPTEKYQIGDYILGGIRR